MYIEEIVEVAIGLIFAWIVLSLACMQVQEWIVALFGIRADSLEDALRGMLADPSKSFGPLGRIWSQLLKFGWVRWFARIINKMPGVNIPAALEEPPKLLKDLYDHPLIKGLAQKGKKPSYIPADKFALALFDVVMTAGAPASKIKEALQPLSNLKKELSEEDPARPALERLLVLAAMANLHSDQLSDETKAALVRLKAELILFMEQFEKRFGDRPEFKQLYSLKELVQAEPLEQLKRGAIELAESNPKVTLVLNSLITQVEATVKGVESALAKTRKGAEQWFNDTMDRLTGWYKRNRQAWAFCIALIFALFFNVDSIEIATRLWYEPALRKAVVSVAESYKLPEEQKTTTPEDDYATKLKEQTEKAKEAIDRLQDTFVDLRLPIGWTFENNPNFKPDQGHHCKLFPNVANQNEKRGFWYNGECKLLTNPPQGWGWLVKSIGVIISAGAAMQGAPFWFDILGKLISVRAAGKKPGEN
jgi:hypothetical protein